MGLIRCVHAGARLYRGYVVDDIPAGGFVVGEGVHENRIQVVLADCVAPELARKPQTHGIENVPARQNHFVHKLCQKRLGGGDNFGFFTDSRPHGVYASLGIFHKKISAIINIGRQRFQQNYYLIEKYAADAKIKRI